MQILKRIVTAIAYFVGIVILLLIILTVVSQTQFFKDRLRVLLVSTLSSQLNGTLHLGTIRGDFITGIEIESVNLYFDDRPCFTTGTIRLQYDPFALLEKKIVITDASIDSPVVHFYRPPNGEWNITQLFASEDDTSAPVPFDWTVVVQKLSIQNGSVSLLDSLSLTDSEHDASSPQFLEYHNFAANDINVAFSATYKEDDLAVVVEHISFTSHAPEFQLTKLMGEIHTSHEGLSVKNLAIQTNRSALLIDGSVKGLNVFKGMHLEKMENNSTKLQVSANPLDVADLKVFLEPLYFLEGLINLDLDVAGKFGDLNIKQLKVQTYSSNLTIYGELLNLHRPEDLALDVYIVDSKIDPSDASKLLKPFNIPSFDGIGVTSFSARYIGKPLNFSARVLLNGGFGGLDIDGALQLNTEQPQYSMKFSSTKLDLASILDDASLASSLFTKGEIIGKGFSPNTMTAEFKVDIDSGIIRNTTLTNSEIGIHAESGQFDISALLRGPEMNLTTEITLDFSDPQQRRFETAFTLYSVDLERIFNSKEFDSDISGSGTASGSGTSLADLSLKANITLDPSRIRSFTTDEEHLLIDLNHERDDFKHLSIQTTLVDLEVTGDYDIDFFVKTFPQIAQSIERSITSHVQATDVVTPITTSTADQREYNFHYHVNIKNLEKLSSIIGKMPFNGYGEMEGNIRGTARQLSLTSTAKVNELFVGNIKKGLFIDRGELTVALENITQEHTLTALSGNVLFRADALVFNQARVDSVHTTLKLDQGIELFEVRAIVDSEYTIAASGEVAVLPAQYDITIPHFAVRRGLLEISNEDTLRFTITDNKVIVKNAKLMLDSTRISFTGTLSDSENTDFQIAIKNLELTHLPKWFGKNNVQEFTPHFGGTLDATITATQGLPEPVILASVIGNNIHYKQTRLGVSTASLYYAQENLRIDITLKRTIDESHPFLAVSGTVPINLSLDEEHERFPDKEQRLQITSTGFELGLLEPLLPDFNQLSGTVTCNMLITGTPRAPYYSGTVSIRDGKFLFLPNYVRYNLSGDLEPTGNKIALKNFVLTSAPEENIRAKAVLNGTLTMKDFQFSEFDISINGDMLLMTNATRRRLQTMYGMLHTSTDEHGLRISGNLERPFLEGTMFIKEANLIFPPAKEFSTGSSLLLPPIIIDDTSRVQTKRSSLVEQFYTLPDSVNDTATAAKYASESPLLSRLRYNLLIATQGETQIKMIFAQATNEELYAELDGRVNAVNNSGTPSIYGQISVLNRSYYNFLKRFNASGKLKFIGQWDNPELEINAVYQGTRTAPQQTKSTTGTSDIKGTTSSEQRVFVHLDITGTRYQPRLEMSMKTQDEPGANPEPYTSGDVQADAISFILTGKFREQLTSSDKENIAESWGTTAGTGLTSTFLSGLLTDFLQKEFSFIRSAELTYKGGNLQETADLRLSGVAGKGYWRFGGRIFNNLGNANVSYQLSMGDMFNAPSIRNLFIELERKVEGSEASIEENRKLTNTARLYYRFSF